VTRHTIVKALGKNRVEGAIVTKLADYGKPIPGTERRVDCDFICVGVGLNPAYDLVQLFNPKMVYVGALGGMVPVRDRTYRFAENAYIAGDCASIEEATTAVLEGRLVGLYASQALGYGNETVPEKIDEYTHAIEEDRGSPFSTRLRAALQDITVEKIEEALN